MWFYRNSNNYDTHISNLKDNNVNLLEHHIISHFVFTVCLPTFLPVCIPACMPSFQNAWLPVYLHVCPPSTCLFGCMTAYLPVCLLACLPTSTCLLMCNYCLDHQSTVNGWTAHDNTMVGDYIWADVGVETKLMKQGEIDKTVWYLITLADHREEIKWTSLDLIAPSINKIPMKITVMRFNFRVFFL